MPAGLTVEETCEVQELYLTNRPITVQIEKTDAPEQYQQPVRDYDRILNESDSKTWEEGKGGYTFSSVEGAVLVQKELRVMIWKHIRPGIIWKRKGNFRRTGQY